MKNRLVLEMLNGEIAQPAIHLKHLIASQDLNGWKCEEKELVKWIAKEMSAYFLNLNARIVTIPN